LSNIIDEFLNHDFKYNDIKKSDGVVYTPYTISKFMINNMLLSQDIIENPFIKILDPSCGEGSILFPVIKHVYNIFKNNLPTINKLHSIKLKEEMLINFIISNNIFGYDINTEMCDTLKEKLNKMTKNSKLNIFNEDFLFSKVEDEIDIIIGNPPYVSHKNIDRDYYMKIKNEYSDVFVNKSDLMYTFFKKSNLYLKQGGKCSFITSRYFMEGESGKKLRKYIVNNYSVSEIVDFYGVRPFKNAGIDPVILFLRKQIIDDQILVTRFSSSNLNSESFYIDKSCLSGDHWLLLNDMTRSIFDKINDKCTTILKQICESFQGIITGLDKAFIVDFDEAKELGIDKRFLRNWIKSSNIRNGEIKNNDTYLIYSDLIVDIDDEFKIKKHLLNYRNKLEMRRECRNGIRKWFHLQWGRDERLFLNEKLIFPFKNSYNNFAYDRGSFFSADVYGLILNEHSLYNYDELKFLLNSKVYDFYFKCFGKKLGRDLYEYYPYSVMEIKIPNEPLNSIDEINEYFEFTEDEIKYIEGKYPDYFLFKH